jgi:hypothetical protein
MLHPEVEKVNHCIFMPHPLPAPPHLHYFLSFRLPNVFGFADPRFYRGGHSDCRPEISYQTFGLIY